jgi:hypothetical protein
VYFHALDLVSEDVVVPLLILFVDETVGERDLPVHFIINHLGQPNLLT